MNQLIDIGANLTHESFEADLSAVIDRASEAGVTGQIITGADVAGSHRALKIAKEHPGTLWSTSGVHPHYANDYKALTNDILKKIADADEVVAMGEMGLDFFRNFSSTQNQELAFESQLQIAVDNGKPVFLHQRDAHASFVAILKNNINHLSGGVAHCFTGNKEQMHTYLDMGLYIGITGWICDERRGNELQQAIASLPLDRVLLETDAPYLLPRDLSKAQKKFISGRRNEPALLPHVLLATASHMDCDPVLLAKHTTENAKKLFNI
jgi:TatD DNase family protein